MKNLLLILSFYLIESCLTIMVQQTEHTAHTRTSTTISPNMTTTHFVPPSTTTSMPSDIYSVKDDEGNVCLILKMDVALTVYKNQTQLASLTNLPGKFVSGACEKAVESIKIEYENLKLKLVVENVNETFHISKVNINFNLAGIANITTDATGKIIFWNMTSYSNQDGKAFQCHAGEKMQGFTENKTYSVDIHLTNVEIQAFGHSNITGFNSNGVVDCKTDEMNNLIPIIVGSVLAGIIIIVLIAYLISRRQKRSGYESV